jgi:hypothetical protein
MTNVRRAATVILVLAPVLSCSTEPIPFAEYTSRETAALCERDVRCGFYPDEATCRSTFFTRLQLDSDVATGKVKYDGTAAASCLEASALVGCSDSEVAAARPSVTAACHGVFTATIASGGACLTDAECDSESCNLGACNGATCCLGSCQDRIALGGDCSAVGAACVAGTFCKVGSSGGASCTAPLALGQPCVQASDQCVSETFCVATSAGGPTTCAKLPAEGQSCLLGGLCDAIKDYCNPVSLTCVPTAAVGSVCPSINGCPAFYAACSSNTYTCVPLALPGAACTQDSDCLSFRCQNRTCVSIPDVPSCQ